MAPHFDFGLHGRVCDGLDPDLVGLPPAFAIRVYLHRRGWSTRQATIAGGSRHVADAERDGHRFRCEAERPELAWSEVLRQVEPGPRGRDRARGQAGS